MPSREAERAGGLDPCLGRIESWGCPPPPVDPARILRIHKYRDLSAVRPVIHEAAERAVAEAAKLSRPVSLYTIRKIESLSDGRLVLDQGVEFSCDAFDRYLSGADHLLSFVMTIGPSLDQRVLSLVNDTFEPLDALFLETAGWLTIESATKSLAAYLKQEMSRLGYRLSLRMGPGYQYPDSSAEGRIFWDLWQQRELFSLFDGAELPITLMESCAMSPKMSRSGVFGLVPAAGQPR